MIVSKHRLDGFRGFPGETAWQENKSPYTGVDAGEALTLFFTHDAISHIKHLVLILHNDSTNRGEQSPGLVQALLLLEVAIRKGAKLKTLFVFSELDEDAISEPSGNLRLDILSAAVHLLPAIKPLGRLSPALHVHFSLFYHIDDREGVPTGPQLNSDTAVNARSYLSAVELDGGSDCGQLLSGISFSLIKPNGTFEISDDGRYLLSFSQSEQYSVQWEEDEELRVIRAVRRVTLDRADRLSDHNEFVFREDPWFEYQILTPKRDESVACALNSLEEEIRHKLALSRERPFWEAKCQVPFAIQERLMDSARPDNDFVEFQGEGLAFARTMMSAVSEYAFVLLTSFTQLPNGLSDKHLYLSKEDGAW
ncbi:hypothetical protein S40285_10692 [Stachybotrys chlorohalonatus IBT 40285]|uniref:Uncharacterized protein n=1 Tax=Stachybotrys chlorohalonatus (strain IBT 40285) TaxID=1283841 RepID=A0A084QB65_STAC4|nr:hypothetical protein S40285_10692 [Stachybotrys chlorohalonata IBT 40285]